MFCQVGQEIKAKLKRAELEAHVAAKNYKFTGSRGTSKPSRRVNLNSVSRERDLSSTNVIVRFVVGRPSMPLTTLVPDNLSRRGSLICGRA